MAADRAILDALRPFELHGVIDTEKTVGKGAYATVNELDFRGLKCVGKKIHAILYQSVSPEERAAVLGRFAIECRLLSQLHHPCIVQFLGVHFEERSQVPVMVMEYLHTTLAACLERNGVLPEVITYEVLRDVALGLRYLHEHLESIVHRDLSANNVLLTVNMNAKIADLGVAKILNLSSAQMTQTCTPGTPAYMPPETMVDHPKYTNKVDIFSYGVMMLHMLSGEWPIPGGAFREDPDNPGVTVPVSEFDRRAKYFRRIPQDHSLRKSIRQCLDNAPSHRPEAADLHEHMVEMLARLPLSLNRMQLLQQVKTLGTEATSSRNEIESLQAQMAGHSVERGEALLAASPGPQQAKLQWRRCADLPVAMGVLQSVVHGGKVYIGGGTATGRDRATVFQYDPGKDRWLRLPLCPVGRFGMGQFGGHLITVGGETHGNETTGKLHRYRGDSHSWEEYLKPMPAPRRQLTVITAESAIVTCGGKDQGPGVTEYSTIVEVYAVKTDQWHQADPLPIPCGYMTSAIIDDTCYLLGGVGNTERPPRSVLSVSVSSLITKATSSSGEWVRGQSRNSLWRTLQDAPLRRSAAASLCGSLLTIGGTDEQRQKSSAIYTYVPPTNSWVQVSGDLPVELFTATTASLPDARLLVCGGKGQERVLNTVYMGRITHSQ